MHSKKKCRKYIDVLNRKHNYNLPHKHTSRFVIFIIETFDSSTLACFFCTYIYKIFNNFLELIEHFIIPQRKQV